MIEAAATTSPPTWRSSWIAAAMVPPVASRSSSTTTRSPGLDRVGLHLDHILAIFQVVVVADDLARQLAAFADHHEADAQEIGEGGRDQEAAALDPDQLGRLIGLDCGLQTVHGFAPSLGG